MGLFCNLAMNLGEKINITEKNQLSQI